LASFAGGRVFPIVAWHIEALYRRAEFGWSPLLSPSRVHEVLDDRRRREAIPSALTILGFVGVSPLPIARRELSGLRSMARTIAMVPSTTRAHRLTLAEFDAQGTAVVELEGDDARVLVGGDSGARQGSGMSPVWHRFYEEQLLDWAVRTDSLPSYVMEPQAPRKSG
jgi:hypothetical protein